MVRFVLFLQAAENGDRVFHARFINEHFLETTFKRRILFNILTIFVQSRRTDDVQFTAGKSRLQHIARIHRALGFTRAHHRMNFIDEENDAALGLRHFLQKFLQTFLKFTAVLGARDQARHIKRQHGLAAQRIRHFVVDDTLSQALDDGRLAHTGFTDQHGVILGAALQNLHRAANLIIAPDHGIQFSETGAFRQVHRVLFDGFASAFTFCIRHFFAAPNRRNRRFEEFLRNAGGGNQTRYVQGRIRRREKEHFGRNKFIPVLRGFLFGEIQSPSEITADLHVAVRSGDFRQILHGRRRFAL